MRDSSETLPLRRRSDEGDLSLEELEEEMYYYGPQSMKTPSTQSLTSTLHPKNLLSTPFNSRLLGIYRVRQTSLKRRLAVFFVNFVAFVLFMLTLVSFLDALLFPSYSNPPAHYRALEESVRNSSRPGRGNLHNEKIFIASNIIQEDLIRGHWGSSVLELIDLLGPSNVFLSIYENDSGPGTQAALHDLRKQLTCEYSIVTGDHLPLAHFPTVILPNGESRVKRITYLAEVRNRLLKPLDRPKTYTGFQDAQFNHTETKFDRVLFINDVYFKPVDALNLLFSTNINPWTQKADYSAACAADFIRGFLFYDTFVVRDLEGYGTGTQIFPWFSPKGSQTSRRDVLAEKDAVRVSSCWGGMVAYDAGPFLRPDVLDSAPGRDAKDAASIDPKSNPAMTPLRFRHEPEVFWESSESCLINADLLHRERYSTPKIFLNPYIRVAYSSSTWAWLPFFQRIEHVFTILQYTVSTVFGTPEYNQRRTEVAGQSSIRREWVYENSTFNGEKFRTAGQIPREGFLPAGSFQDVEEESVQPGGYCGQRRLFVMMKDLKKANEGGRKERNWEQIRVP